MELSELEIYGDFMSCGECMGQPGPLLGAAMEGACELVVRRICRVTTCGTALNLDSTTCTTLAMLLPMHIRRACQWPIDDSVSGNIHCTCRHTTVDWQ